MSDGTAAMLFGKVFGWLAEEPTEKNKARALELWRERRDFDFSPYQMDCEEALKKLGLARKRADPDDPDRRVWFYGPKGDEDR